MGMLKSSMKMQNCLPSIGPHIVYCSPVSLSTPCRRFSNLPSRMSCVWLADVCAEKAIMIASKPGSGPVPRYLASRPRASERVPFLDRAVDDFDLLASD